jgi:hypothetical protein
MSSSSFRLAGFLLGLWETTTEIRLAMMEQWRCLANFVSALILSKTGQLIWLNIEQLRHL